MMRVAGQETIDVKIIKALGLSYNFNGPYLIRFIHPIIFMRVKFNAGYLLSTICSYFHSFSHIFVPLLSQLFYLF